MLRYLLAGSLLLGSPLSAQTYFGCGQLNTCASVSVIARPLPSGEYDITITVRNRTGQFSALTEFSFDGLPHGLHVTSGYDITDRNGQDMGRFWVPTGNGLGNLGFWGYTEEIDPFDPEQVVISSTQAGVIDPDCECTPTPDEPGIFYQFSRGMTFHFTVDRWQTPTSVLVSQRRDITTGVGDEDYVLTPRATVTPEPVSMVLFGTGLAGIGLVRRKRLKNFR